MKCFCKKCCERKEGGGGVVYWGIMNKEGKGERSLLPVDNIIKAVDAHRDADPSIISLKSIEKLNDVFRKIDLNKKASFILSESVAGPVIKIEITPKAPGLDRVFIRHARPDFEQKPQSEPDEGNYYEKEKFFTNIGESNQALSYKAQKWIKWVMHNEYSDEHKELGDEEEIQFSESYEGVGGVEERARNRKFLAALPIGSKDWPKFVNIPKDLSAEWRKKAREYTGSKDESVLVELFKASRRYFSSRRMFFAYLALIDPKGDRQREDTVRDHKILLVEEYEYLNFKEIEPFDLTIFGIENNTRLRIKTEILPLEDTKFKNVTAEYIDVSWALFRELEEKNPEVLKRVLVTLKAWEKKNEKKVKKNGTIF